MEEIAFGDWPGQPVDLNSGNNPWLPAYGFEAPTVMLERDDFNGNPDADYFLHGGFNHYVYLETILEETSDDLRSESDGDSRGVSPVGWLATDSETGSVICIDPPDEPDCDSDRELACPAKRRKQEIYLCLPAGEEDLNSLSRSSSLLQFETLEKQCQEAFSFDDSATTRKPLEEDYYKTIKIDVPTARKRRSDDSLSLNRSSGSDTSESDAVDISRSFDNLKPWRSFDSLQVNKSGSNREKLSAENLSEDSGYGEHSIKLYTNGYRCKDEHRGFNMKCYPEKRNSYVGFSAYDGDIFQEHFNGNFGVSYHDLTLLKDRDSDQLPSNASRLIESLAKGKKRQSNDVSAALNLARRGNAANFESNFKSSSTSEPNLPSSRQSRSSTIPNCVCSVPKDLNLVGFDTKESGGCGGGSVAVKNWNLADFRPGEMGDFKRESSYAEAIANTNYKREGSYAEAMANRVDLSDDEHSLYNRNKPKLPKSTIVEFDKQVLKAISEQSIQSLIGSNLNLQDICLEPIQSTPKRNVVSTPNLSMERDEEDAQRPPGKGGIAIKSSPSSSEEKLPSLGSFSEEKLPSLGSFSGSLNSKGVHFSPVVSEVNWRDDSVSTVTPDRESSCSLGDGSTPERRSPPRRRVVKSKSARLSCSQPELSDGEGSKREFLRSLKSLREDLSKSQPEVARFRRRGSQLVKKDEDGSLVKAYVDRDGIQYKHTHLDVVQASPAGDRSAVDGRTAVRRQPVGAMEVADAHGEVARATLKDPAKRSKASGKLGGFFSRLAGFRFSLRKGDEGKGKAKKKGGGVATAARCAPAATMAPQQRLATKSDYIYIPLKGPNSNNSISTRPNHQEATKPTTASLTSKPPLPKQPPRVVHASVKPSAQHDRDQRQHRATTAASGDGRQHRRRTIDSTAGGPLSMEPMGLIETDLDTEVTVITSGANAKTRSLLDLGPQPRRLTLAVDREGEGQPRARPHKSMEFLLDKQNLKVVEPPENELQKGERVMSEHQLRVQRSLQKLTIPDWYKQSPVPREGFLLKNKHSPREPRWNGTGTGSKTTSLSSLGSTSAFSPVISPTPLNQPFVRWSTSKLNSTASSPCASTRSSFNARQPNGSISPSSARSSFSYRQPYLGWRSQERLSRPRTPAERLASTLLAHQQQQQEESPEIQTSIKEVTSAIVHYVSGLRPDEQEVSSGSGRRSSSASPRGSQKLCWLESSFVGTRPLDSPQTPVGLTEGQGRAPVAASNKLRLDLQTHNDVSLLSATTMAQKPSPSSTTLEDVLDSLLGLPSTGRAPSPSLQETVSANTSPCHKPDHPSEQFRRRSEGSEPASNSNSRRVSFTSSPVLRCRYSRCARTVLASSSEANAFKNCHNCSYAYCSRACRRAHWEKHRKTCLFSRIGTLCRQVIAASKEKRDTLQHLSLMARRGYLSHGIGCVKCFFPNPEAAESFLGDGLTGLGELTYVRWQDLLPSEMGPQLYAELVKMCKNYNPDTRLVLYVSICVISESPASGSVKWERQLVSRCAKMRLSKDQHVPADVSDHSETLVLTSPPVIDVDPAMVKAIRERTVANLQVHLKRRGVLIRKQQPDVYKQLLDYCGNVGKKFTPITMYPKDGVSGKNLMCIIMMESNEESVKEVENAGVRVKTINLLND